MPNSNHVLYRTGIYYLNRKVPTQYKEYDRRGWVRFSLKTSCKKHAVRLAALENIKLELFWESLIETGEKYSHQYYKQTIDRAAILGFEYLSNKQIAQRPLEEIKHRLVATNNCLEDKRVEAIMGTVPLPEINLSDLLKKYFKLANDIKIHKTPNQIRKWENPRKRAIKNFILSVGNMNILNLKKDDFLKFRNWWLKKIVDDGLSSNTANKDFTYLKVILNTIRKNYKLKIDLDYFFEDIFFDEQDISRPSFTTEYIINTLLLPQNLAGLNQTYRDCLLVIAETGVSFSEQTGLLPEDIILDSEIPHIIIKPRQKKKLKTKYRERLMPLTGYSLEVFKRNPNGFPQLFDQTDNLSSAVGKYLRENNLFPTQNHSVYSLRHSFQNRLLEIKANDRIQAELMGHKFQREKYGEASLKLKYETMLQIQLKPVS